MFFSRRTNVFQTNWNDRSRWTIIDPIETLENDGRSEKNGHGRCRTAKNHQQNELHRQSNLRNFHANDFRPVERFLVYDTTDEILLNTMVEFIGIFYDQTVVKDPTEQLKCVEDFPRNFKTKIVVFSATKPTKIRFR